MSTPSLLLMLLCTSCNEGVDPVPPAQKILQDLDLACVPSSASEPRQTTGGSTISCISPPETQSRQLSLASTVHKSRITPSLNTATPALLAVALPLTSAIPEAPQPIPTPASTPLLRQGSRGTSVTTLQTHLQQLGHYTGAVDGVFGQLTAEAVTAFQHAEGLQVDGVVGAVTWTHLHTRLSQTSLAAPSLERSQPIDGDVLITKSRTSSPIPFSSVEIDNPDSRNSTTAQGQPQPPIEHSSRALTQGGLTPIVKVIRSPYLWLTLWGVVYAGGWVFIFKAHGVDLIILGIVTGSKHRRQVTPVNGSAIKHQSPVDAAMPPTPQASPNAATQSATNQATTSEATTSPDSAIAPPPISATVTPSPSPSVQPTQPEPPEQLEHVSSPPSNVIEEELPVCWAEDVLGCYDNLFADLVQEYEKVTPFLPPAAPISHIRAMAPPLPVPEVRESVDDRDRSRVIGTFPLINPDTGELYTYALTDDSQQHFLLIGNELRIKNRAMQAADAHVGYIVTVRRTNQKGVAVNKSFVVKLDGQDNATEQVA